MDLISATAALYANTRAEIRNPISLIYTRRDDQRPHYLHIYAQSLEIQSSLGDPPNEPPNEPLFDLLSHYGIKYYSINYLYNNLDHKLAGRGATIVNSW